MEPPASYCVPPPPIIAPSTFWPPPTCVFANTCAASAAAPAGNVLSIVRQIEASGVTGARAIAAAFNARGVRTARGGTWHDSTVRNLLARARA
jgi:Recombinase